MTLDAFFPLAGTGLAVVLFALLAWKRVFHTLPVFTFYQGSGVCIGPVGWLAMRFFPQWSLYLWIANAILDILFFLCVFAEIRKNVLRYNRTPSPLTALLAVFFVMAGLALGSLAELSVPPGASFTRQCVFGICQASAILEVAALLALVTWSGVLGLHWPERELKIVTGLAFYALVALTVVILHSSKLFGWGSHWLDFLPPASYLCVLVYWLHYFWLAPGTPRQALDGDAASATNGEEKSTAPQEEMPWFAGAGPAPWRVSAPPREG